jgi:hypothetical protein
MKRNPKIVYKYRDWSKPLHKRILTENEIYLASPKEFNDPFDCRINQNFSSMIPREEDKYINDLAIAGFEQSEKDGRDFYQVLSDFEKRIKDKSQFQRFADKLLFDHQDRSYGIFPCSIKWNSILMWSHYAANHTGFCVGFWVHKMMDYKLFGKLGQVTYEYNFPFIKPRVAKKDRQMMKNSFIETHTKAKEWHYEKEYRFMSNLFPKELTDKDRIKSVQNDFIAEVILGIAISDQDRHEIINLCKTKNITVYQAKKVDFKFKVSREKIK